MDESQWFFDIVKALGVGGGPVFAVLWWLERAERKHCQQEAKEQLEKLYAIASQSTAAMTEMTKGLEVVSETSRDAMSSFAQLAQMIRSLGNTIRRRIE